jgi:hypothetical protein
MSGEIMLNYTHPELLVETEWLMDHLANPNPYSGRSILEYFHRSTLA